MPAERSAPHSRKVLLRTIGIDEVGRVFFFVWLANITTLYFCLYVTGGILAEILLFMAGAPDPDLIEAIEAVGLLIIIIIIIPASLGFAGWNAWKNINVLTAVVRPLTVTSLLVFAVIGLGCAGLALISLEGAAISLEGAAALSLGWYGLIAAVAAISIIWLRSRKIKDLDLRLTDFIRLMNPPRLRSRIKALPYQNAPLGWFLLAGGAVALLLGANITGRLYRDLVSEESTTGMRLVELITNLSCFLLLYARTKFQPMAEMVLKSDQRPPVLFLRSFMDDERKNYMQADKSLFDFSLESRLAGHFSGIGPFIAVGSPRHKLPGIGAARAALSDSEWRGRVIDWMHSAQLIIVMAGVTQWIGWELRQVIDRGYADKLILIFPLRVWLRSSSAKKEMAARLDTIKKAFCGTRWEAQLGELHEPMHFDFQ